MVSRRTLILNSLELLQMFEIPKQKQLMHSFSDKAKSLNVPAGHDVGFGWSCEDFTTNIVSGTAISDPWMLIPSQLYAPWSASWNGPERRGALAVVFGSNGRTRYGLCSIPECWGTWAVQTRRCWSSRTSSARGPSWVATISPESAHRSLCTRSQTLDRLRALSTGAVKWWTAQGLEGRIKNLR